MERGVSISRVPSTVGARFESRLRAAKRRWAVSSREAEVLTWLAQGDSNKEIAAKLQCAEVSVERHVSSLLRKAGCDSRSRLIARFWGADRHA